MSYRWDQVKVWELADNGKRYKRRRVRVQNRIQIRAQMINRSMERQFRRWLMLSFADSVRTDTDDVFSAECTFVNAGRSDLNVPLRIADRQIFAGHGRKSFVIYPLHKHDDLVCWMDILNIHIERSL